MRASRGGSDGVVGCTCTVVQYRLAVRSGPQEVPDNENKVHSQGFRERDSVAIVCVYNSHESPTHTTSLNYYLMHAGPRSPGRLLPARPRASAKPQSAVK